jgi:predicted DNA-binding antitoxin AbrB/MazE fold protein
MTETIDAVYERNVLVPLEDLSLREHQLVRLQIVPPQVVITAATARRMVTRFVLDEISYLMGGEQPSLVRTDRLVRRVPVVLTYPMHGKVGEAGSIDVDAETGDLFVSAETIEEITHNARASKHLHK